MATPPDVVLRREELYELVWAEPMRSVAARLGISDVALGKACKRLGVPRPARGYWAKVAAGHRGKRPRPSRDPRRPAFRVQD